MIKRNLILGFGFCVLFLLQVITMTKIDKIQNKIDVEKIYKDEISYSSIKEKRFNRKEGTFSPITIQKFHMMIIFLQNRLLQRICKESIIIQRKSLEPKVKIRLSTQKCQIL